MVELTHEDNFRLNILLATQLQAIRIDETKMIVYGLSEQGEAKIQLHPVCQDSQYLIAVRELISNYLKKSSGVYPLSLRNWNQMGETKVENLAQWLMLGEDDAVVAVTHTQSLTPELAQRAWWAMPNADNARSMLKIQAVVQDKFAQQLANYLIEFLPFEIEPLNITESVRLILQPNLISETKRQKIWQQGQKKSTYLTGFLWAQPDNLPLNLPAPIDAELIQNLLKPLVLQNNQLAIQLVKILSPAGQAFLKTCERALQKPPNQEVVNSLFDAIANYFMNIRPQYFSAEINIFDLIEKANRFCGHCLDTTSTEQQTILAMMPELKISIKAMLILSGLGYSVLRPVFSNTTAAGSLMRKKLTVVNDVIFEQLNVLQNIHKSKN
ncbi:MAG: hypothetical protein KAH84_10985 [Thiomargarita sp.]|nr:hypothetical protein [Thiomargarita sp.]